MKKWIHPLLIMSLAGTAACTKTGSSDMTWANAKQVRKTNLNSDITVGSQKIGEITRVVASDEQIEKAKERKRSSTFLTIPVDPEHNATVFKLSGIDDAPQYLVMPRVFVYGTQVRTLAREENGQIVLPFNIAIIDGLRAKIDMGESTGQVGEIPASMRVTNYEKLKEDIKKRENIQNDKFALGAVSGCPSRISIVAGGSSYDVTPAHLNESDICELNRPFSVSLKVPEKTATFILNEALRSKMVDVIVNYSVMVPIPVSQVSIRFNKSKFFEAIEAQLSASYPPFGEAEVSMAIENVVKSSQMNMYIQGDYNEQMQTIVKEAIKTYFEPFKPDPKLPAASKCDKMVCLSVRVAKQTSDETFSVNATQTENMKMEKVLRIGSKLQPINDQIATIGKKASPFSVPTHFTNKNANPQSNPLNIYAVGLTPQKGTIIEFAFSDYTWERRKRETETLIWKNSWRDCTGSSGFERSCSYTWRNEFLYTKEFTGDDVWETIENPLSSLPILGSLKLYTKFTNGEYVICDIESLEGFNESANESTKRVIKIENTPQCVLFDKDRRTISDFGIINAVRIDDITYEEGQRFDSDYWKKWNTYKTVTYSPEVRISGTVKLLGQGFISLQDIK